MVDRDDRYYPKKWPPKRPPRLWRAVKVIAPYLLIVVVIFGAVYWFALRDFDQGAGARARHSTPGHSRDDSAAQGRRSR